VTYLTCSPRAVYLPPKSSGQYTLYILVVALVGLHAFDCKMRIRGVRRDPVPSRYVYIDSTKGLSAVPRGVLGSTEDNRYHHKESCLNRKLANKAVHDHHLKAATDIFAIPVLDSRNTSASSDKA
jgi:hypothetical protein